MSAKWLHHLVPHRQTNKQTKKAPAARPRARKPEPPSLGLPRTIDPEAVPAPQYHFKPSAPQARSRGDEQTALVRERPAATPLPRAIPERAPEPRPAAPVPARDARTRDERDTRSRTVAREPIASKDRERLDPQFRAHNDALVRAEANAAVNLQTPRHASHSPQAREAHTRDQVESLHRAMATLAITPEKARKLDPAVYGAFVRGESRFDARSGGWVVTVGGHERQVGLDSPEQRAARVHQDAARGIDPRALVNMHHQAPTTPPPNQDAYRGKNDEEAQARTRVPEIEVPHRARTVI